LDNYKIESFQSADALGSVLAELDFGLGDASWIEDDLNIFGMLYYRDFFKHIQFLLAHVTFQVHLNVEPVHLAGSKGRRVYSEMISGYSWWDTQDQLPARATIVPVIWASNKTHLTNFTGDQHGWPLYRTIDSIGKHIHRTPKQRAWLLIRLIQCSPKGPKNIGEAWHNGVGTVLSQLRHYDITGPGLKWDCGDGFQQQCYPLLASWVRDYP
jgi:hypothetical protein